MPEYKITYTYFTEQGDITEKTETVKSQSKCAAAYKFKLGHVSARYFYFMEIVKIQKVKI